eukprot:COSAG01_NODE_49488_length_371_cov_3.856618_1_plen_94_part_01
MLRKDIGDAEGYCGQNNGRLLANRRQNAQHIRRLRGQWLERVAMAAQCLVLTASTQTTAAAAKLQQQQWRPLDACRSAGLPACLVDDLHREGGA